MHKFDRESFWRAVRAIFQYMRELKDRLKDVQSLKEEIFEELKNLGFVEEAKQRERNWTSLLKKIKH